MFSEITSRKIITVVAVLLILATTIGGIIIWSRYVGGDPVVIYHSPGKTWNGTIFIGGSVNTPGYYPFAHDDTIDSLIRAAGGSTDKYSLTHITLLVASSKQQPQAQKIDINHAEKWLLEALPGIGETIAQHIIDYRMSNGKFTSTLELLEVDGIGTSIYERIKENITVSD